MTKNVNFEDIARSDLIDIFVQQISGDENEVEMFHLISVFTAYNLADNLHFKFFYKKSTDEIIKVMDEYFNGSSWFEEEKAWNCAIETLGEKIFDIIDNFQNYMEIYTHITKSINSLHEAMRTIFTKF